MRDEALVSTCRSDSPIATWIEQNLDSGKVTGQGFMGSSSWSNAYRYDTESGQRYFVKEAKGQDGTMFKGEALGLQALYGTPRGHKRVGGEGCHRTAACPRARHLDMYLRAQQNPRSCTT